MFVKLILALLVTFQTGYSESITGNDRTYLTFCLKAATTPYYFQNFRSIPEYAHALELQNGEPFAQYILNDGSENVWANLKQLKKLDSYGNPQTAYYPSLGNLSGTTLRYIFIADEITKRFDLPSKARIVEIGGGFGGQCYILSQMTSISKYIIYDLKEPSALIQKMMEALEVHHATCLSPEEPLIDEPIDLLISNYAFSECDREAQAAYFEKVLKKADRGYLIYNQTSHLYGLNSLSPIELIALLKENGIEPTVLEETIPTFEGNLLITWDKTQ